jgi:hypothetical protein
MLGSVAAVFNTGEVWIINAWGSVAPGYINFGESWFAKTLDGCALFLDELGCARPYWWVAGMEGIEGWPPNPNALRGIGPGPCVADVMGSDGIYEKDAKATELLQPVFEDVFDKCGARRPAS